MGNMELLMAVLFVIVIISVVKGLFWIADKVANEISKQKIGFIYITIGVLAIMFPQELSQKFGTSPTVVSSLGATFVSVGFGIIGSISSDKLLEQVNDIRQVLGENPNPSNNETLWTMVENINKNIGNISTKSDEIINKLDQLDEKIGGLSKELEDIKSNYVRNQEHQKESKSQ